MFFKRLYILLFACLPSFCFSQMEICDNGIDDDFDNLVDLNDDDCTCELIEPVSLIPNPSFEVINCCPDNRSQLNCATDWIQASEPTTDLIHSCNWFGWDDFPPPVPFPDGDGIMGFRDGRVRNNSVGAEPFWKEYAGACLISPLKKDSSYRFQFDVGFVSPDKSPAIDITFFGTSDCQFLPFGIGDEAFGCPSRSPNWVELGSVRVDGGAGNKWVNTFIEIVPEEDINAIAIGPSCRAIDTPISLYYFFDNLLLSDLRFFELQISEQEHPCSEEFILAVPDNPNFDYQWYLFGEALSGERSASLSQNYGEGEYQVRVLDGQTCLISSTYEYQIPVFEEPIRRSICEGDFFEFGDRQLTDDGMYIDTFPTRNGCDSIVFLDLSIIGDKFDTVQAYFLEGESYRIEDFDFDEEGDYSLSLSSSIGCDSLVLLQLESFGVFIPNVFNPISVGVNQSFKPTATTGRILTVDMQIYDRWGNVLYKGPEWTGLDDQTGVYLYRMDIAFENGSSKVFYGSVTLLR